MLIYSYKITGHTKSPPKKNGDTTMKERTITRTIEESNLTVMVFNVNTEEIEKIEYRVIGNLEGITIKDARKIVEDADHTLVKILSVEVTSGLYGMPESTFLAYAERLPDRK